VEDVWKTVEDGTGGRRVEDVEDGTGGRRVEDVEDEVTPSVVLG
jgi:hypothetical protein